MGREVGGISGWGIHVHPWLIHVNVWQKSLQYCQVISLQLKEIDKFLKMTCIPTSLTQFCDILMYFLLLMFPLTSSNSVLVGGLDR